MSQCPKCNRKLTDDFGLIECPGCKTPLVLDLDGAVRVADEPESPTNVNFSNLEEDLPQPPAATGSSAETGYQDISMETQNKSADLSVMTSDVNRKAQATSSQEVWGEPMQAVEAGEDVGDTVEDQSQTGPEASDEVEVPDQNVVEESGPTEEKSSEEAMSFLDDDDAEIEAPPIVKNPADLSDLADFGNSVDSHSRDGGLRYKLIISGIDSADLRASLKDVLSDKKLMLDHDLLLKSVKAGVLHVDNINAVKATLLAQKISELPVEIKWEQHAIYQK